MDALINVFVGLGVDQTIAVQFVIFVIVFWVLKLSLFNKLKEVIIYREDQTHNLIKNSDEINQDTHDLESNYKDMVNEAHKKAQVKFNEEKRNTIEVEDKRFKNIQKDVLSQEEKSRTTIQEEIKIITDAVLKSDDELSNQLVDKLIN